MKVREIIELDYRYEENREIIQDKLKLMKPFSKYSDEEQVPMDIIEKFIGVAVRKYDLFVRDIKMACIKTNKENLYSMHVYEESSLKPICTVYGCELYELMAKAAIYMYALIKSEKVGKRDGM